MLRRRNVIAVAACLVFAALPMSGFTEKAREWQAGRVVDSERARYYAGSVGNTTASGTATTYGNSGTYQGHADSSQTAVYRVFENFVIEGETYVYFADERLRWRWSKAANVTVNGPVKYAVEKSKLFILDDDGKEHEMEITKRVLKTAPGKEQ